MSSFQDMLQLMIGELGMFPWEKKYGKLSVIKAITNIHGLGKGSIPLLRYLTIFY